LFVILSFIIGITYSVSYGRPKTIMIEFLIAWALD
jgi:ABC-type nickel/cobalt efflux system permease component RcnA